MKHSVRISVAAIVVAIVLPVTPFVASVASVSSPTVAQAATTQPTSKTAGEPATKPVAEPRPVAVRHSVNAIWFSKPMPGSSHREHLGPKGMSQWLGDSRWSVVTAAHHAVGGDRGRYVDNNVQVAKDGDIVAHSHNPKILGYKYILTSHGKRRALTRSELNRSFSHWNVAAIHKLRRTKTAGKSFESRVTIDTVEQRMTYAKRAGVIPYFELKSPTYGTAYGKARLRRLVAHSKRLDAPAWFMSLDTMSNPRGKAQNVYAAHGKFALLGHRKTMPYDFRSWASKVGRVYGRTWLGL